MLSDERIETLEDFAAGFANNAFSKTHELHLAYGILELVAELRSVRTREYREPVASDDQTMVWVPDIAEPVNLYWVGEWKILYDGQPAFLSSCGGLICPVEQKPAVTRKESNV